MEEDILSVSLQEVKNDLCKAIVECNKRGLLQSVKWLAEMNHGLSYVETTRDFHESVSSDLSKADYDNYYLGKSYFDLREYDRAAYFTRDCESRVPKFLHYYATYMAKQKRQLESVTDNSNLSDSPLAKDMSDLLASLKYEYSERKLDGYGLYLYAVVLKNVGLNEMAIHVFVESIQETPMLWSSYVELAPLISEKEKIIALNLPNHWMKQIFLAHAYIELYLNYEGLKQYENLRAAGFQNCIYITSQMALAYHNKREVDKAIEVFQTIQEVDPYRLDNLDTYSNLLFVKELKTEMASLAHKALSISKYRPETCCVIGNYYSIRSDHQKAIMYFQRALKLNPQYLAAWTLMGHEFMELKNTNAAIQSYRKAVEVNKRDYRAWYGLGQSYEILKMHYYSLYYFKNAHKLRPFDSRMLVALGETYEKLEKNENAIRCYLKACNVGDIEGIALYKLANLYEKLGNIESAVPAYISYCADERAAADKQSLFHAYITLANYYENNGQYEKAAHYAYKCLESDEKKSEAKSLLKTIENKRLSQPVQNRATSKELYSNDVMMDASRISITNKEDKSSSENVSTEILDRNSDDNNTMDMSTMSMD
ncbi:cell division cycle protein 23 homolog [Eupeodes corollae]|uniref:cell division cycle protein 23 homolog n=1 Tax=Eupeodes corollae TaxID=290404 RepID=UPI00248F70F2|nr:cell division cycle protein 23 homolog [Eupeodes corollae]XP_055920522.1 cell division cycle protein 23 homolog [Eupeodes corollae]XP_055920523.1 cell division cycle protein 23 homolog [Eupeodes corollae]